MSRIDLIPETILACCVLHNICIDHLDHINDYILCGEAENNEVAMENNERLNQGDMEGINKRNYIAQILHMLD